MFDTRNFDAKQLLDRFLTPQAGGTPAPWAAAPAETGQGTAANGGDLVGRAKDYLAGNGGALAGGAAAGALVSLVLGSKAGRKLGKNAVALGGLALVGTLAYKAYQNYQNQPASAPAPVAAPARLPPPDSPFNPTRATDELPLTLLRTMIAAALADGHVDPAERAAISAKLGAHADAGNLSEAERFLAAELAAPASVEAIAGAVTSPEEAAETYVAALLAIDPDSIAERAFLARLAAALRLDPALTPHLEAAARTARAGA